MAGLLSYSRLSKAGLIVFRGMSHHHSLTSCQPKVAQHADSPEKQHSATGRGSPHFPHYRADSACIV
ncbi:hypothetical protein [Xenorhabdus beddingii]|nr:hypothetical protein [Xenorhabdus beddingii]